MNHVTAALLDLSNILGGFLLSAALLADLPRVGQAIARAGRFAVRGRLVVGVLALVMGGYYLIMHVISGPHVFHFEIVGLGVGVATLRDRIFPGFPAARYPAARTPAAHRAPPSGGELLLAVFGLIAIVVGIQGLLTPDG